MVGGEDWDTIKHISPHIEGVLYIPSALHEEGKDTGGQERWEGKMERGQEGKKTGG